MSAKNNSVFEKQLYLSYTEDGFLDLAIGFVILFFGLSLWASIPGIVGIITIFPLMAWYIAKVKITSIRTGIFNQNKPMKIRFRNYYLYLIGIGTGILVLIISSILTGSLIPMQYPLSMFGLILATGISGLALLLRTNRFYIHAVILFAAMTIGENLNSIFSGIDTFILATIIGALIILGIGTITTIRFLKAYPVLPGRTK